MPLWRKLTVRERVRGGSGKAGEWQAVGLQEEVARLLEAALQRVAHNGREAGVRRVREKPQGLLFGLMPGHNQTGEWGAGDPERARAQLRGKRNEPARDFGLGQQTG